MLFILFSNAFISETSSELLFKPLSLNILSWLPTCNINWLTEPSLRTKMVTFWLLLQTKSWSPQHARRRRRGRSGPRTAWLPRVGCEGEGQVSAAARGAGRRSPRPCLCSPRAGAPACWTCGAGRTPRRSLTAGPARSSCSWSTASCGKRTTSGRMWVLGPGLGGGATALRAGPGPLERRVGIRSRGASGWTAAQGKGRGWRRRLHSEPRPGGTLAAAGREAEGRGREAARWDATQGCSVFWVCVFGVDNDADDGNGDSCPRGKHAGNRYCPESPAVNRSWILSVTQRARSGRCHCPQSHRGAPEQWSDLSRVTQLVSKRSRMAPGPDGGLGIVCVPRAGSQGRRGARSSVWNGGEWTIHLILTERSDLTLPLVN